MTYLTEEAAGADPVELFEFTFGADVWRYVSSNVDYVHPISGFTFVAEPVSRGNLQQSEEDISMTVEIMLSSLNPVADFFRTPYLPGRQVWLVIYGVHRGSGTTPAVKFRGQVGSVTFDGVTAKLSCVPLSRATNRNVPIQLVQQLCTNTLYDARCQVDPAAFSVNRVITLISGLTFSLNASTGHPVGYYSGGFIEGGGHPPATIKDDLSGTLKMLYNPGYTNGDAITIYAGCDKKFATCATKFNNVLHYQGFHFMPMLDPFNSEIP